MRSQSFIPNQYHTDKIRTKKDKENLCSFHPPVTNGKKISVEALDLHITK